MPTTISTAPSPRARVGKYLTFTLGCESYALPVLQVGEIIRLTEITPVPQMPPHIKGVINLRGKIVPVLDLGLRFGMPTTQLQKATCIVVVQLKSASDSPTQIGLIVDAVEEVTNLAQNDLAETPDFGPHLSTEYLLGMAKLKGKVL